jgi:predicted transcriptional regulator
MKYLKSHRTALRLSQSGLSRLAGVSRQRIHFAEMGDFMLTTEEQRCIFNALQSEIERIRNIAIDPAFSDQLQEVMA